MDKRRKDRRRRRGDSSNKTERLVSLVHRGDGGETDLPGAGRVAKSHPRLEAIGSLDELMCAISEVAARIGDSALATDLAPVIQQRLRRIQGELFEVGAVLSAGVEQSRLSGGGAPARIKRLEIEIAEMEAALPRCRGFVLPGGSLPAAAAHVARAVCRRAERDCVAALGDDPAAPVVLPYLNRLGNWLFALARWLTKQLGDQEVYWERPRELQRSRSAR